MACASDLEPALREIAERFAREDGARIELVFGSSGVLTRPIREGAPFELFLSADEGFVEQLPRHGLTLDGGMHGIGRIGLSAE